MAENPQVPVGNAAGVEPVQKNQPNVDPAFSNELNDGNVGSPNGGEEFGGLQSPGGFLDKGNQNGDGDEADRPEIRKVQGQRRAEFAADGGKTPGSVSSAIGQKVQEKKDQLKTAATEQLNKVPGVKSVTDQVDKFKQLKPAGPIGGIGKKIGLSASGAQALAGESTEENRKKVKEEVSDKLKNKIGDKVGDKLGEGFEKGLNRGLNKTAGKLGEKAVEQGAQKVAGQVGKQVGQKVVQHGAKEIGKQVGKQVVEQGAKQVARQAVNLGKIGAQGVAESANLVIPGLGLVLGLLLQIAISLGVDDAVDAGFKLKDGDLTEATFLGTRAAMKVLMFLILLILSLMIFTIFQIPFAILPLITLNLYVLVGWLWPRNALMQGIVWWEIPWIIILDMFVLIIVLVIALSISISLCQQVKFITDYTPDALQGAVSSVASSATGYDLQALLPFCKEVNNLGIGQ